MNDETENTTSVIEEPTEPTAEEPEVTPDPIPEETTEVPEEMTGEEVTSEAPEETTGEESSGSEEIYTEVIEVVQDDTHYFMTTDLADFTVTEGLLLCILIVMILKAIGAAIKEGFYWLW